LLPLEPADDPDSGLFGFVGPEGLIGLFALPLIVEPPMVEPPIVEPLPEGEVADGLPVKPGEVDPEVPSGRAAGRGRRVSGGARRGCGITGARAAHSRSTTRTTSGTATSALRIDRWSQCTQCEDKGAADEKS